MALGMKALRLRLVMKAAIRNNTRMNSLKPAVKSSL